MDRDTLRAAAFVVIVIGLLAGCLSACGGGVPQRLGVVPPAPVVVPPAVPPSTPAPPPPPAPVPIPPSPVPTSYALTILPPVTGGSAAQAEAVNDAGLVVGWSIVDGQAAATEWISGQPQNLGQGFALAINQAGIVCGYAIDVTTGNPIAKVFPNLIQKDNGSLGTLPAYDSSEATGIDDDGTIVGVAFVLANPSIQQGWKWTLVDGMVPLANLQSALAIRKGTIVGIGNNVDAWTDVVDLGLQGAATAISSNGSIAGFTFGTTQGFVWTGTTTLLGTAGSNISLAVGINAQGIAVGQVGNQLQTNVRLARRAAGLPRRANFVGSTRAMAWDQTEGIVDLNSKTTAGDWSLVFSTGINDEGSIVGAAVNSVTQVTNGFLLEAQ